MLWETVGLLGILTLWAFFGLLSWCGALILGRGRGAWVALPFALIAGMGGGLLVPALGSKGGLGFGISLLAAALAGGLASAVVVLRAIGSDGKEPT